MCQMESKKNELKKTPHSRFSSSRLLCHHVYSHTTPTVNDITSSEHMCYLLGYSRHWPRLQNPKEVAQNSSKTTAANHDRRHPQKEITFPKGHSLCHADYTACVMTKIMGLLTPCHDPINVSPCRNHD